MVYRDRQCRDGQPDSLLCDRSPFRPRGSFHAFGKLAERGVTAAAPGPTVLGSPDRLRTRRKGARLRRSTSPCAGSSGWCETGGARMPPGHGVKPLPGSAIRAQGIVHVVRPEQGAERRLPYLMIVCGDSHTSTHGALGALCLRDQRVRGRPCADHANLSGSCGRSGLRISVDGVAASGHRGQGHSSLFDHCRVSAPAAPPAAPWSSAHRRRHPRAFDRRAASPALQHVV